MTRYIDLEELKELYFEKETFFEMILELTKEAGHVSEALIEYTENTEDYFSSVDFVEECVDVVYGGISIINYINKKHNNIFKIDYEKLEYNREMFPFVSVSYMHSYLGNVSKKSLGIEIFENSNEIYQEICQNLFEVVKYANISLGIIADRADIDLGMIFSRKISKIKENIM